MVDLVSSDIIDDGAVEADLMRIADHGHREGSPRFEYVNPKVDIAFLGQLVCGFLVEDYVRRALARLRYEKNQSVTIQCGTQHVYKSLCYPWKATPAFEVSAKPPPANPVPV